MSYIGFHIQAHHSTDDKYIDWMLVAFQHCEYVDEKDATGKMVPVCKWKSRIGTPDVALSASLPDLQCKLDVAGNPLVKYTDKHFGKIVLDEHTKEKLIEFLVGEFDKLTEYTVVTHQQKVVG